MCCHVDCRLDLRRGGCTLVHKQDNWEEDGNKTTGLENQILWWVLNSVRLGMCLKTHLQCLLLLLTHSKVNCCLGWINRINTADPVVKFAVLVVSTPSGNHQRWGKSIWRDSSTEVHRRGRVLESFMLSLGPFADCLSGFGHNQLIAERAVTGRHICPSLGPRLIASPNLQPLQANVSQIPLPTLRRTHSETQQPHNYVSDMTTCSEFSCNPCFIVTSVNNL